MYRSRRVFDTFVPFSLSSHVLEDFLLKGPTNLVSFLVHAVDKMLLDHKPIVSKLFKRVLRPVGGCWLEHALGLHVESILVSL